MYQSCIYIYIYIYQRWLSMWLSRLLWILQDLPQLFGKKEELTLGLGLRRMIKD